MKSTSRRRRAMMASLLLLAVAGAAIRYAAPVPSIAHDIGTLLLVMWLPAVGNLVAFVLRELAERKQRRTYFDEKAKFAPHLMVRLARTARPHTAGTARLASPRCIVALGAQGFTARARVPLADALAAADGGEAVALQLLRPALALRRLAPGTSFTLMAGDEEVAQGTVSKLMRGNGSYTEM